MKQKIIVQKDWDGFFERLVTSWVEKVTDPKHETIIVTGQPFQPDALIYESNSETKTITLSFYPAIRNGFGELSKQDVEDIIEIL